MTATAGKSAVNPTLGSANAAVTASGTAALDADSSVGGSNANAPSGAAASPTAQAANTALAVASGFGAGAAAAAATAAASLVSSSAASSSDGEPDDADFATEGTPGIAGASGVASALDVANTPDSPAPAAALALSTAAADLISGQSTATLAGLGDNDKRSRAIDAGAAGGVAAAGLSQPNSTTVSGADAAAAPTLRVSASVDGSDFPQALSDRVSWMVDNGLNGARLQVNPPQLGPIELRIAVQGDHAQVSMITHSEVTRAALESSSPTLREMLGAQGFAQVSVDISQRSFQDRSTYSQPYEGSTTGGRGKSDSSALAVASITVPRTSSGVVDAYA